MPCGVPALRNHTCTVLCLNLALGKPSKECHDAVTAGVRLDRVGCYGCCLRVRRRLDWQHAQFPQPLPECAYNDARVRGCICVFYLFSVRECNADGLGTFGNAFCSLRWWKVASLSRIWIRCAELANQISCSARGPGNGTWLSDEARLSCSGNAISSRSVGSPGWHEQRDTRLSKGLGEYHGEQTELHARRVGQGLGRYDGGGHGGVCRR